MSYRNGWAVPDRTKCEHSGSHLTVSQYLPQWLDSQQQLRPSTRMSYEGHIRRFLIPTLGPLALCRMTVWDITGAYQDLRSNGMSEELLKRVHATLSSALTAAVRSGLIKVNPAATLRPSTLKRFAATVWTRHEAVIFLEQTADDPLAALWRLALVTGLRRGELLGLRWRDVDLERATVSVRQTRTAVGGRVVVGPPKSRRGRRMIALDGKTVVSLAHHRREHIAALLAEGRQLTADRLVFTPGTLDEGIYPAFLSRRIRILCDQLNLPQIRFHDLRHTSATLGLATGESLVAVSARLGHSSVTTTADLYLQIPEDSARRSVTYLASVLDDDPLDAA